MKTVMYVLIFAAWFVGVNCSDDTMPLPFYRQLFVTTPLMTGDDISIAQTLLNRDKAVSSFPIDGVFGDESSQATASFQQNNELEVTGILDSISAQTLLNMHSADNYKDTNFTAASMGYLYKFHVPVHTNRSIETISTLYDKDNNVMLTFKTRQHGHREDGSSEPWPDYGNGDVGLNQFTSNGNTITGLVEIDLNSPEPDPQLYGPWPVNRVVRGLEGNAFLMLPMIRDGVLIHTGNWTTSTVDWDPRKDMPNSSGCIHAHPSDVEKIYKILLDLGATVNDNPFSGKDYPYKPQGVGVVELID